MSIQFLLIRLVLIVRYRLQRLAFWSKTWDKSAIVSPNCKVLLKNKVWLGANTKLDDFVIIKTKINDVVIGKNVQINFFSVIYGGSGVEIGDNVMIGPHVMIAAGNHDYKQTGKPMRMAGNLSKGPIVIEDDVWLGANVSVTDGVKIGRGAVIGANSVVTKNIPAYSVAFGVPAKVIFSRKKRRKGKRR